MCERLLTGLLASTCVAAAVAAEPGSAGDRPGAINAADFAAADSLTGGIQEAIDALPKHGGVLTISPGEYALRRSIRLRSNVTLQGAGLSTVLRKTKQVETRLVAVASKGSRSLRVESSLGFAKGDQVAIRDRDAQGWNVVQAIVDGVAGNELLLDRPMPRTCDSAKGGFVVHAFPALDANGASNIVIKNLAIRDDNVRDLSVHGPLDLDNPRTKWVFIVPFPVAAVSLVDVTHSRVERVTVVGWLSDGISLQRGANNTVVNCQVEKCGGNGIGGLGDWGDKYNAVTNNVCEKNGAHGIHMGDGDNNTVTNNSCRDNSQLAPGQYSGISLQDTSFSVVRGNRCFDDQATKTQKHGIEESGACHDNQIADNDCHGNAQADLALAPRPVPQKPPRTRPRREDGS